MNTVYLFDSPGDRAALHLVRNSALEYVTAVTADYPYAGGVCTRVDLDTPRPSKGEKLLWAACEALTYGYEVPVLRAGELLDADNRAALFVACGIALGIEPVALTTAVAS